MLAPANDPRTFEEVLHLDHEACTPAPLIMGLAPDIAPGTPRRGSAAACSASTNFSMSAVYSCCSGNSRCALHGSSALTLTRYQDSSSACRHGGSWLDRLLR